MPALQDLGFTIETKPQGAFYLYANCSKFTHDSMQFCKDLLEQTGVAITPGADFGSNESNAHVRFAYTTSMGKLERAVDLMHKYLNVDK